MKEEAGWGTECAKMGQCWNFTRLLLVLSPASRGNTVQYTLITSLPHSHAFRQTSIRRAQTLVTTTPTWGTSLPRGTADDTWEAAAAAAATRMHAGQDCAPKTMAVATSIEP